MLISAHEEQLASVTSLCKQEMKLLLGAKAGHKVSSVQEQREKNGKREISGYTSYNAPANL